MEQSSSGLVWAGEERGAALERLFCSQAGSDVMAWGRAQ